MRRAANAGAMLDAIREAADIGVHVLAPQVETLFGAVMGSRSAFVDIARGGLFLDLGGGSVQMTWVDTRLQMYEVAAALAGESMPFGAARLIRVLEEEPAEIRSLEKRKLSASLRGSFMSLCDKFPALKALKESEHGIDVYLCGGGFRGYGSILMHTDPIQPYPIPSMGSYTVPGHLFKRTKEMARVNDDATGKIFGMSKRRRRQFPAILSVVEAFIDVVSNIRTATFCSGSNRDGSLMMSLPKAIRESNPLEVLANISEADLPVVSAVMECIRGAVPQNVDISSTPTVFSLGLDRLFVEQLWAGRGEDDDAHASFVLHDAMNRDSAAPGLTHLTRAVLGLTTCARWGSGLGPIDAQLYNNLCGMVDAVDDQAVFWINYVGAVAAVIGILVPVWPKNADEITKAVRYVSFFETIC